MSWGFHVSCGTMKMWRPGGGSCRVPAGTPSAPWSSLQGLGEDGLSLCLARVSDQHSSGTQVRVVGVTCAACLFPCMDDLRFPVVVLDECSQVTEPASLLPIAR